MISTGPPAQDYFVRTSKFFNFYLDIYIYIYKRLKWFVKQHQVHKTK